jgi:FtsP/CotA-like multicopper oxidase with cupredoxin domain
MADQYVLVQQTLGTAKSQTPLAGARVTLSLPDGSTLTADELRDTVIATARFDQPRITSVYRFALAAHGVSLMPGAEYELRVVAPDGSVVSGRATIPGAPTTSTAADTVFLERSRDTLSLSWPRVSPARRYEVVVIAPTSTFSVFADTAVTLPGTATDEALGPPAFVPGATQQLLVSAVDQNYYDYYRRDSDFYTGTGLISHLNGGLGLFGAVTLVTARIVVVR